MLHTRPDVLRTAFEAEKHLLSQEEIRTRTDIPLEAIRVYEEGIAEGVPTGISLHPEHGWMVIWSAGQGPGIAWMEKGL